MAVSDHNGGVVGGRGAGKSDRVTHLDVVIKQFINGRELGVGLVLLQLTE